jgi:hypothetical protein
MTDILGVLVIACNGGQYGYYQDPKTYEPTFTKSTPDQYLHPRPPRGILTGGRRSGAHHQRTREWGV